MLRRAALTILFASLATACEDPLTVEDVRVPIRPISTYSSIWAEMVECSERSRAFDGVRWFQTSYFPGQPTVLGQWNSRREITLRADVLFDPDVVGHEILHDLLKGDPRHESPAWDDCGIEKGLDTTG